MAQRLTIQIKNKIASWVSGEPIVCGNGDYEVEFLFDAEWDAHDIKTAIFNVNGDAIPKVFTGTICKVPIIRNTLMVSVGVFAGEIDDGTLSTSTPALVECLRCATDGGNLVDPPKNDVYMDIVQMVEDLNTEIEELKKGGASEEQIADAVRDYLTKNPINESDPTVPEWAKAPEKPTYTAKDVGALPEDTPIPSIDGLATEKYVDEKVAGVLIPESGTTDYTKLENKPKINGVELDGDKTLEALGIPTGGDSSKKWRLIKKIELTEDTYNIRVDKDEKGNDFELDEAYIYVSIPQAASTITANTTCYVFTDYHTFNNCITTRITNANANNGCLVLITKTFCGMSVGAGAADGLNNFKSRIKDAVMDKKITFFEMRSATAGQTAFGSGFTAYIYGR